MSAYSRRVPSATRGEIVVTEEHFAACLIECGPHTEGLIEVSIRDLHPLATEISFAYYHRVYDWYCKTFVYMGEGVWYQFLSDYMDWVEK